MVWNVLRFKFVVFSLCLVGVFGPVGLNYAQDQSQSWSIDAIMAGLRGLSHVQATFDETRHSAFLSKPLELKGTFVYKAPQTFIKETFRPFPEIVTVDENGVKIEQEKETQEGQSRTHFISANAHPLVKGLVDGAAATMSGKKELLEAQYDLELEGTEDAWTVQLIPKEKALRKKIEVMLFQGSGDLIEHVTITEADGDLTEIRLQYKNVERN